MIDTDKYEGHTPAPWKLDWSDTEAEINKGCEIHIVSTNKEVLEKFTINPSTIDGDAIYDPYITSISCGPSYIKGGEYITEANARLIADAPLLLEQVKVLTKTLELIGKNMEYDSWMHTLIKDVIGFEKWQAKELIE